MDIPKKDLVQTGFVHLQFSNQSPGSKVYLSAYQAQSSSPTILR